MAQKIVSLNRIISGNVARLMTKNGMGLSEFSKKTGITYGSLYNRIRRGMSWNDTDLSMICKAFGVTAVSLVREEENE